MNLKSSLIPFFALFSVASRTVVRNRWRERSEVLAGGWAMMGSPPGPRDTSASIIMVESARAWASRSLGTAR